MEKRKPKIDFSKTDLFDDELPVSFNKDDGSPCRIFQKKKWKGLSRKDKRIIKRKGDKAFMITMMFSNGTCREFVIVGKTETFTYKKRTFYLRYEDSWFNLTQNQFGLYFFDDFPVPISREIIRKGDKNFFSVTPENLKPLIKMEYVRALASSDDVLKRIRTNMVLAIINLFFMAINLIVLLTIKGAIAKLRGT